MSGAGSNYPPTRSPVINQGQNTVSREWLRYFLTLGTSKDAGGSVPAPTPGTALDFIRINAAGNAYEVQTPAQVLADIGALTLAEAEALFEPLLDNIEIKYGNYQVTLADTGLAILMATPGTTCVLPGNMQPGVKVFIAAGAINVKVFADGNGFLNGVQGGYVTILMGQGAYCEVVKNDSGMGAYWTATYNLIFQGPGVPAIYEPPGTVYVRDDEAGQVIDRVYVSNGFSGNLPLVQNQDGAIHQYIFNETSGTTLVDTGTSPMNGTYTAPFALEAPGLVFGQEYSANIENSGYATLPFDEPPMGVGGAFSVEIVFEPSAISPTGRVFNNARTDVSNTGFCLGLGQSSDIFGGFIAFGTQHYSINFTNPFTTGSLNHIVMTYDGTTMAVYQNGVICGTLVPSGAYVPGGNPIQFGQNAGNPGHDFAPGQYQCAAMYNYALTAAQVLNHWLNVEGLSPSWSDVQAQTIQNSAGLFVGTVNSWEPGQYINLSVSNEIVTISSSIGVEVAGTLFSTLAAGPNITLGGTSPDLTISSSIGVEVAGTLFPTLHAGANITFGGATPDLTISSSGGSASGTLGVEYAGTLYPTLAAGTNIALTPGTGTAASNLTISSSGGGGLGTNYYSKATSVQSIPSSTNETITGCVLTIPGSTVVRIFAVSFFCMCSGGISGEANAQIVLDSSGYTSIGYYTSDGTNKSSSVVGFVTVPGDGASHTISGTSYFDVATSTFGTPYFPSISATQIA
jgi:hypothetical protein